MMTAVIEMKPVLKVLKTEMLFDGMNFRVGNYSDYDIHPDGNKFMFTTVGNSSRPN